MVLVEMITDCSNAYMHLIQLLK